MGISLSFIKDLKGVLFILLSLSVVYGRAQTILATEPDITFTPIPGDDPIYEHNLGAYDVSTCTSVRVGFSYQWSLPWAGSGNLETPDECGSCNGDPFDPQNGDCNQCWDFLFFQIFLDGSQQANYLIGDVGWTSMAGSYSTITCTNGKSALTIEFDAGVYAINPLESVTISNIVIECWEGAPDISANDPICETEQLDLMGSATDETVITDWFWDNNATADIDDPSAKSTFAVNAVDGEIFTLTATDINNCNMTTSTSVEIYEIPIANDPFIEDCVSNLEDFDLEPYEEDVNAADNVTWYDGDPNGGGVEISNFSEDITDIDLWALVIDGNMCTNSVQVTVEAIDPPSAEIGGGGILCEAQCTDPGSDIFFVFQNGSGNYTITLEVSGFAIPGIAVATDQTIRLCYDESGLTPTINTGTDPIEIHIPTIYSGSFDIVLTAMTDADTGCPGTINTGTNVISITLEAAPQANVPDPLVECILQGQNIDLTVLNGDITGGNASLEVIYFFDQDATSILANPENLDPSTPSPVYAATDNGGCLSVIVPVYFEVLHKPEIDIIISALEFCADMYILPEFDSLVTIDNVQSPGYFLDADLQVGPLYPGQSVFPEDNITRLYIYDAAGPDCADTVAIDFLLEMPPVISGPTDTISGCGTVVLPEPEIDFFTSYEYNTEATGEGISFSAGDTIQNSANITILYLLAYNGDDCISTIEVNVDIASSISFTADLPAISCGDLVLPPINPTTPGATYYSESGGNGPSWSPGDTLSGADTINLFIYDISLPEECIIEPEYRVAFSERPVFVLPTDTAACSFYILPQIDGMTSPVPFYHPDSISFNNPMVSGDTLFYSTTVYVSDTLNGCIGIDSFELSISALPEPGNNVQLSICEGWQGSFDFMALTSVPDSIGYWQDPEISGLTLEDSTNVDLSLVQSGMDTVIYVIDGDACGLFETSITLFVSPPPFPGLPVTTGYCSNVENIDFHELLGDPDPGGAWTQIGGLPVFIDDYNNVSLFEFEQGQYSFEYGFPENMDTTGHQYCQALTTTLSLNVFNALYAGSDNQLTACFGEIIDLNLLIPADADSTGVFESSDVTISANMWDTNDNTPGASYTLNYIVIDTTSFCSNDTALVIVTLSEEASAGIPQADQEACQNTTVDLHDFISGETPGGYFSDLTNQLDSIGNMWMATSSASFTYIIPPVGNCLGDTTAFSVSVLPEPVVELVTDMTFFCPGETACSQFLLSGNGNIEAELVLQNSAGTMGMTIDTHFMNSLSYLICPTGLPLSQSPDLDTIFIGPDPGSYLAYFSSLALNGQNAMCESSLAGQDTLMVAIGETMIDTMSNTICPGDSIEVDGSFYFNDTLLQFTGSDGCDSMIQLMFEEYSIAEGFYSGIFCEGQSVEVAGFLFTSDIQTRIILENQSAMGCDSVINVDVAFDTASYGFITPVLCRDESIIIEGITFDSTNTVGNITIPNGSAQGCDSIVSVSLSFYASAEGTANPVLCPGDSIQIGTDIYSLNGPSGITVLEGVSANGCDSIVQVALEFYPAATGAISPVICETEVFTLNGDVYDIANPDGTSVLPGQSSLGCDSIVTVSLEFHLPAVGSIMPVICETDVFIFNGDQYDIVVSNGTTVLPGQSTMGCDSIVNVTLDFFPPAEAFLQPMICEDQSFEIGNDVYTSQNPSGTTILQGTSQNGCDSLIHIDLDIFESETVFLNPVICSTGIFLIGGDAYDISNAQGTTVLQDADVNGCDSIVSVSLNFHAPAEAFLSPRICENEDFLLSGDIYNAMNPSGTTVLPGQSANGCDSIVNVSLEFFPPASSILQPVVCPTDTFFLHGDAYSLGQPSGMTILENLSYNGCDSIINVQLDFYPLAEGFLEEMICEDESITLGSDTYNASNLSGTTVLPGSAANGCDSIVGVTLTLAMATDFDLEANLCPGDSLILNGTAYHLANPNGVEILTGANAQGCDSIVNIILTFDYGFEYIVEPPCPGTTEGLFTLVQLEGFALPVSLIVNGFATQVTGLPAEADISLGENTIALEDAQGCSLGESIVVTPGPAASVVISAENQGENLYILGVEADTDITHVSWSPSELMDCPSCYETAATLTQNTTVFVDVTYGAGCIARDSISLAYNVALNIYVPNIFSPDDDGVNDRFFVQSNDQGAYVNNFRIYDRWGNLVFNAPEHRVNDPDAGWDGRFDQTFAVPGIYVYLIEVVASDGSSRLIDGEIALIR